MLQSNTLTSTKHHVTQDTHSKMYIGLKKKKSFTMQKQDLLQSAALMNP